MNNLLAAVTDSWFWRYFFSHFGWVDWVLTAFVLVGLILGLKHGVSQELPRIAETLISIYITMEYYEFFAAWIARETPWPESYARIFTFAALGFLSWLLLRLLFGIVGKLIHLEVAAPLQIAGGFFLGGVRYFFFFCFVSYLLALFPLDFIHRSYQVQSWSGQTVSQIPEKLHEWVRGIWLQQRIF